MTDSISFLGEIAIEKAELISHSGRAIDISGIMLDLTLYEDMFSSTMSGYVLIQDALDLVASFPMIGQEQLEIKIKTPTLTTSISKIFYVYKMEIATLNLRSQSYMLHFCSKEQIYSSNTKISKAFSGNIGDTVNSIFRDSRFLGSKSNLYMDKPSNDYSFIAPYWTPIETINWLTTKSINSRGVPNYLFYETSQTFEYVSIDTLVANPVKRKYIFADIDPNTALGVNGDMDEKYSIVQELVPGSSFDYLKNITSGMLASRLHTIDLTTKNINSSGFDYIDDFSKANHLDKYPTRTENVTRKKISNVFFLHKNNYLQGSFNYQGFKNFFLQRNSLMEQITSTRLNIKVHGRTDIKVGQVIHLTMPKSKQVLAGEIESPSEYYTGNYLITAIRHQIVLGVHTMEMEISSDAFSTKIK